MHHVRLQRNTWHGCSIGTKIPSFSCQKAFVNVDAFRSDEKDRPTLNYGPTFILLCSRLKYRSAIDQLERCDTF